MVKYSSELKAEVVSEYLQGDISISLLSKKRNLPRIQVGRWIQNFREAQTLLNEEQLSLWRTAFNQYGIEALKPHPKGRKTKVKHNKKKLRKLVNKNEILKKSMTLFGTSKDERKHKQLIRSGSNKSLFRNLTGIKSAIFLRPLDLRKRLIMMNVNVSKIMQISMKM